MPEDFAGSGIGDYQQALVDAAVTVINKARNPLLTKGNWSRNHAAESDIDGLVKALEPFGWEATRAGVERKSS